MELVAILIICGLMSLPFIAISAHHKLTRLYKNRGRRQESFTIFEAIEASISNGEIEAEAGASIAAEIEKHGGNNIERHKHIYDILNERGLEKEHEIILKRQRILTEEAQVHNANLEFNRLKGKYLDKYEKISPTYLIEKHLLGKDTTKRKEE